MRLLTLLSFALVALLVDDAGVMAQQGMPLPSGTNIPVPQQAFPSTAQAPPSMQTPPSMQNQNFMPRSAGNASASSAGAGQLPRAAGQEHRVYDLRPYTGYLTNDDRPEQAIVDWILRETGTDVWFTEPFGFMNATRDSAFGLPHQ